MTSQNKLTHVDLQSQPLERLGTLLDDDARTRFESAMRRTAEALGDRTVWNINSSAEGGGVAEMLSALLPYPLGAGWDLRWVVMFGTDDFFEVTKAIHNALHGEQTTEDIWGKAADVYQRTTQRNAEQLLTRVRPGDVVIAHDPQAAGLIPPLVEAGARVAWQCHIGTDTPNDHTRRAWKLLWDFIEPAQRYVFTRESYLWDGLDRGRLCIIPPAIDAFSAKNASMTAEEVDAILSEAEIIDARIPSDATIVLQVSRWDRLKDPVGFLRMSEYLADLEHVHLVYAGPEIDGVDDDPESADVHAECMHLWQSLSPAIQRRVHLLTLPMDDIDKNAAIVNALQRRADIVVQKSLQEGFGLTVAEAMWKQRPVVASRVGGIQDQIVHGENGWLVDDPSDIASFADAVRTLIEDPDCAQRLGSQAERRVHEHFLAPRQLTQYAELVRELIDSF